jgi:hypothetical protein
VDRPSAAALLDIAKDRLRSWTDDVLQRFRWAERLAGVRRGLIEFGTDDIESTSGDKGVHGAYSDVKIKREKGWFWDRMRTDDASTGATVEVDGIRKRDAISAEAALEAIGSFTIATSSTSVAAASGCAHTPSSGSSSTPSTTGTRPPPRLPSRGLVEKKELTT